MRWTTVQAQASTTNTRFYQILLGIWPPDDCLGSGPASPALVERVRAYMQKAVREAGVDSSWVRPDEADEAALDCFVRRVLEDESAAEFRSAMRDLVRLVLPLSVCHSITQLVLKCLMPGLPDIYQGGESWLLTVTDPDNRQPVDFAGRADALRRLSAKAPSTSSGSISPDVALAPDFKLDVTAQTLTVSPGSPIDDVSRRLWTAAQKRTPRLVCRRIRADRTQVSPGCRGPATR